MNLQLVKEIVSAKAANFVTTMKEIKIEVPSPWTNSKMICILSRKPYRRLEISKIPICL